MTTSKDRPSSMIFYSPRKRTLPRGPQEGGGAVQETTPLLSLLGTYLHLQEERRRLPGYFSSAPETHEKRWPALRHPVPSRDPFTKPDDLAGIKLKQIVFEPFISSTDDLNMIYNESYLEQLADIGPRSPRGWRGKREERKRRSVISVPGVRRSVPCVNNVDFIEIRADIASANRYFSAWNANLSAAEDERTRQVCYGGGGSNPSPQLLLVSRLCVSNPCLLSGGDT